jgi:SsrA-binding protein
MGRAVTEYTRQEKNMAKKPPKADVKPIARNKKARFQYEVLEKFEAGIALRGTEVKSLRDGKVSLNESFARVEGGELILRAAHISEYKAGSMMNHEPTRPRKLLMHRREIMRLSSKLAEKGLTLVPLSMYFRRGLAKVELGLVRGKKLHDKRETIRRREAKRSMQREMARRRREH